MVQSASQRFRRMIIRTQANATGADTLPQQPAFANKNNYKMQPSNVKSSLHKTQWPALLAFPCILLVLAVLVVLRPGVSDTTPPALTALFLLALTSGVAMPLLLWKVVCQQRRMQQYRRLAQKLIRVKRLKNREEVRALRILNHIVNPDDREVPGTDVWQNPLYGFSGDLAIVCEGPNQQVYALLADLTGHGITAAMGAAPVASIFKATARQGMSVDEIIEELNNKLAALLPSGFFCCAAVIVADARRGTLNACNAGLPELVIAADDGAISELIPSSQLPLGIQTVSASEVVTIERHYSEPHQIYAITDGLIECEGPDPDLFNMDKLCNCIAADAYNEGRLAKIISCRAAQIQEIEASDDITVVEVAIC